jgi:twitching motility protein PilT
MKAAETGHLLISTLHTPDAQSTIMRIMAMFPPEEQDVVRIRLAESLYAVVSQRLLPRADGKGRVPACEVMINTPTIRELILDGNRIGEIRDYITEGREQYGMQTFDQHLADLVTDGSVEYEVALGASTRPSDFELQMKTFRRSSTTVKAADVGAALAMATGNTGPMATPPRAAPAVPAAKPGGDMNGLTTGSGFDFLGNS